MNGVKTIFQTIPTFLPKLVPVGLLLLGLILGFIWAYGISPTVYTAAEPVNLGASWKQEWVKQVAWQFNVSGDAENAKRQLAYLGDADQVVASAIGANANDPGLAPKLAAIQPFAAKNEAQLAKVTQGFINGQFTPILCVVVLGLITGGFIIFNTMIPVSFLLARKTGGGSTAADAAEKSRRDAIKVATASKTDFATSAPDRGKPVSQFITSYMLNDDVYDDTFSIETEGGEFLGETGAGISKTIGAGLPKKVTAVEAWVFDKNDIKTVTKVLMSDYAYNNEALRAELAPKGDAVVVKPGLITMIETTTLSIQVRVVDLAYESGATGDNSFFNRLTLEIAAWPKKAPTAGIPDPYGSTQRSAPPPPAFGMPN